MDMTVTVEAGKVLVDVKDEGSPCVVTMSPEYATALAHQLVQASQDAAGTLRP